MDYVQEELLRQGKLCSALLLGARPLPKREEEGREESRVQEERAEEPLEVSGEFAPGIEGFAPEVEEKVREVSDSRGMRWSAPLRTNPAAVRMSSAQGAAEGESSLWEGLGEGSQEGKAFPHFPEEADRGVSGLLTEGAAGAAVRFGRSQGEAPVLLFPSGTQGHGEAAGRGGDPEALSRAVQRDARRYDGGFSMN